MRRQVGDRRRAWFLLLEALPHVPAALRWEIEDAVPRTWREYVFDARAETRWGDEGGR